MSYRITHKERVKIVLCHKSPDRVPFDFSAEPEIWQRLKDHLGVETHEDVLRYLDIDCRIISYDFSVFLSPNVDYTEYKTWYKELSDGTIIDIWGAYRKVVYNQYGLYKELCKYPLSSAQTISDLKAFNWVTPDRWDFSHLPDVINKINVNDEYHLRYRIGSIFETAWSLTGFDNFLVYLATQPQLACYIMDRILEVHLENLARVMEIAGNKIDMVYTYDDIAYQNSLIISKDMWKKTLGKRQKILFDKVKSYGKLLMYHSCGAIRPIIDDLVDMGVDVLSPVQPKAAGMDIEELKRLFGSRISFHGGIDIQEILPKGTPELVKEEVSRVKEVLGKDGGYIISPAHHIQADTPLENIFALYGVYDNKEG